jgi:hypothetical protein
LRLVRRIYGRIMSMQIVAHWFCAACDVEGREAGSDPSCWNCGGAVTVTARPTVPDHRTEEG